MAQTSKAIRDQWNKENLIRKVVIFHKTADKDLLDYLSSKDNFSGYIKDLIKADIKRGEKTL